MRVRPRTEGDIEECVALLHALHSAEHDQVARPASDAHPRGMRPVLDTAADIAASVALYDDNNRARELYERLGYGFVKREQESWEYLDEAGVSRTHSTRCAVLAKPL